MGAYGRLTEAIYAKDPSLTLISFIFLAPKKTEEWKIYWNEKTDFRENFLLLLRNEKGKIKKNIWKFFSKPKSLSLLKSNICLSKLYHYKSRARLLAFVYFWNFAWVGKFISKNQDFPYDLRTFGFRASEIWEMEIKLINNFIGKVLF